MDDLFDRLKQEYKENPANVIMAGAATITAIAKALDLVASARSKNAYARQANRSARLAISASAVVRGRRDTNV